MSDAPGDVVVETLLGPIDWTTVLTWSIIFVVGGVLTAVAIRALVPHG